MRRTASVLFAALVALVAPAGAQEAASASVGVLRVLDKITGIVTDVEMSVGETRQVGLLTITLGDCRYPANNPSGDAYELLSILYQGGPEPVFRGWMIASEPALNAMEHPRYDVWPLRCKSS